MENKEIMRRYVLSQDEITFPAFQKRFALSYIETKAFTDELIKEEILEFVSGVTFKVHQKEVKPEEIYKPKDEQEKAFIRILWECVKGHTASVAYIVSKCKVGYAKGANALDWMEENGYITPYPIRRVRLTQEEFIRKFGNPDEETETKSEQDDEEPPKSAEGCRRSLLERLRMLHKDRDDDEDGNEDHGNTALKPLLVQSLLRGLEETEDKNYILDMNGKAYFELKFVNDGYSLRISDGGKTMAGMPLTERKVKNALKGFPPATLENGEIVVTSDAPSNGLMALLVLYAAVTAVRNLK